MSSQKIKGRVLVVDQGEYLRRMIANRYTRGMEATSFGQAVRRLYEGPRPQVVVSEITGITARGATLADLLAAVRPEEQVGRRRGYIPFIAYTNAIYDEAMRLHDHYHFEALIQKNGEFGFDVVHRAISCLVANPNSYKSSPLIAFSRPKILDVAKSYELGQQGGVRALANRNRARPIRPRMY